MKAYSVLLILKHCSVFLLQVALMFSDQWSLNIVQDFFNIA